MHDLPRRRLRSIARRRLDAAGLRRAERVVELAWKDLPVAHRRLLAAIGADRRGVVDRPLGDEIADLRRSAGFRGLSPAERQRLNLALGVWLPELRLVVIDAGDRLLEIAPPGVAAIVRGGDYRAREWMHELVAEVYALLMARRRLGHTGRPKWLAEEIWDLMRRVADWRA